MTICKKCGKPEIEIEVNNPNDRLHEYSPFPESERRYFYKCIDCQIQGIELNNLPSDHSCLICLFRKGVYCHWVEKTTAKSMYGCKFFKPTSQEVNNIGLNAWINEQWHNGKMSIEQIQRFKT